MSFLEEVSPTRMIGHRSLAEMYAKEVLSEVEEGAADVSMDLFGEGLTHTGLCVVLHDITAQSSSHGRRNEFLYSWWTRRHVVV